MIKIAFVIPYPGMDSIVHEVWKAHEEYYKSRRIATEYKFEYFVDCEVAPQNISGHRYDVDVIVSRGATAMDLKEINPFVPVVEIPITSNDLLFAMKKAVRAYGSRPIGIVGTDNMTSACKFMPAMQNVDIGTYLSPNVDEGNMIRTANLALKDGREIIIAGINTVKYCEKNNIPHQLLLSSPESVWLAVTEAKRSAVIAYEARKEALMFKNLLDYAYDGLISMDNRGRIQLINAAACKLLGLCAQDAGGRKPDAVLPRGRFASILNSGKPYENELVRFGNTHLMVNNVPIKLGSENIGYVSTFQNALAIQEAEGRIRDKMHTRGHVARYHFDDILARCPRMKAVKATAAQYAQVDSNVLLLGETGTGKELFAQSMHNASTRAQGPFVAVNCAALPENLLESELFGYVDGAFTGAAKGGKPGLFELAHNGTIFLDEISEMPFMLQSRLLRVIQEREIMRLGHDRVIPVDVRIVCASNKNLYGLVEQGAFRHDLYYRLNVLSIELPPLRQRERDPVLLMEHFLGVYCQRFNKPPIGLSPEAERVMLAYPWYGNIRELRNISEQLSVLNQRGFVSGEDMENALPRREQYLKQEGRQKAESLPLDKLEYERSRITAALDACHNNKNAAAKALGMSRTTLWRKLKELALE